jgi:hypothetical protein
MASGFVELQRSVRNAVAAALATANGGQPVQIYDHVPQDEPPPFVTVGVGDTAEGASTKTFSAVAHAVQVDIYSAQRGLLEAKTLADLIHAAIERQNLSVIGAAAAAVRFEFSEFFIEPDGARGTMRFAATVYP